MTNYRRKSERICDWRFINSCHIIENNDAAWHNCNVWSILFWKFQYLKYHMNEKKNFLLQESKSKLLKIPNTNFVITSTAETKKYFVKYWSNFLTICQGLSQRDVPWQAKLTAKSLKQSAPWLKFYYHNNIKHKTRPVIFSGIYVNLPVYYFFVNSQNT